MGFAAAYSMCRQTCHQKRSRFPTPFIGIEVQKGKSRAQTWAWSQTRSEKSGANGAKTSMIASGRAGGIGCPPSIA
jgi:hypothetical protein